MLRKIYYIYRSAQTDQPEEFEGPYTSWPSVSLSMQLKDPYRTLGYEIYSTEITLTLETDPIDLQGLPQSIKDIFTPGIIPINSSTIKFHWEQFIPEPVTTSTTTSTSTTTETTTSTTTST